MRTTRSRSRTSAISAWVEAIRSASSAQRTSSSLRWRAAASVATAMISL